MATKSDILNKEVSSLQEEVQFLMAEKNMSINKLKKISANQDYLNISKNIHFLSILIQLKNSSLEKLQKQNIVEKSEITNVSLNLYNWKIPLANSNESKKGKPVIIYSFLIAHCGNTVHSSNIVESDSNLYEVSTNESFKFHNVSCDSLIQIDYYYYFMTQQELGKTVSKCKTDFQPLKFKHFGTASLTPSKLQRDDLNSFKFKDGECMKYGVSYTSPTDDILYHVIPYFQCKALILHSTKIDRMSPSIYEIKFKTSNNDSWSDKICTFYGDCLHIYPNIHLYECHENSEISIQLKNTSHKKSMEIVELVGGSKTVSYLFKIDDKSKYDEFTANYTSIMELIEKYPNAPISGDTFKRKKQTKTMGHDEFYKQIPSFKFFA